MKKKILIIQRNIVIKNPEKFIKILEKNLQIFLFRENLKNSLKNLH